MPVKFQVRRSNIAGRRPGITDLERGELAINFQDRKIYTRAPGTPTDTIIELGGGGGVTGPITLFDRLANYVVDDLVIYQDEIYRCTATHSGNWDLTHFSPIELMPRPPAGVSQSITAADPADTPFSIVAAGGQTADLFVVDTNAFVISASGDITATALSGTGTRIVTADGNGQLGATASTALAIIPNPPVGTSQVITAADPNDVPLSLVGAAGQSADLFQVANFKFQVKPNGDLATLTGKLGIGTNAPQSSIHINKSDAALRIQRTGVVEWIFDTAADKSLTLVADSGSGPNDNFKVTDDGKITIRDLNGTGTRMVVADAAGQLATQAIPSGGGGSWTSITGKPTTFAPIIGTSATTAAAGNHNHDTRYYTHAQTDARYLKLAGGTLTGNLTINPLRGTATRMVTVTSGGLLKAMAFPTGGMTFVGAKDPAHMPAKPTPGEFVVFSKAGTLSGTAAAAGDLGIWDGTKWDVIPNERDLSNYYTKSQSDGRYLEASSAGALATSISSSHNVTFSGRVGTFKLTGFKDSRNSLMLYIDKNGTVNRTTMPYTTAQNDARYFTRGTADARFLKLTGGTVSGRLTLTAAASARPLVITGLKGTGNKMLYIDKSGSVLSTTMPKDTHDWAHITGKPAVVIHTGNLVDEYLPVATAAGTVKNSGVYCGATYKNMSLPASWQFGAGGSPAAAVHAFGASVATGDMIAFYSDIRLKENIQTLDNALDKVCALNGFTYTPNQLAVDEGAVEAADKDKQRVGVAAQDVEKVLPEAVTQAPFDMVAGGGSKSGNDYKTVQYEKLVPLLVEAIKELKAEIEELKNGR